MIDWLDGLAAAARPADHGAAGQGRLLGRRGQAGAGAGAAGLSGLHPQAFDGRELSRQCAAAAGGARSGFIRSSPRTTRIRWRRCWRWRGTGEGFEFQRLHGMGEALHDIVREREGTRCRIYAPVGAHRDLLAYLVRRLLENGANSSFVNQIVDKRLTPEAIAADPLAAVEALERDPESAHPAAGGAVRAAAELARVERERAGVDRRRWPRRGRRGGRIAGQAGPSAGEGGRAAGGGEPGRSRRRGGRRCARRRRRTWRRRWRRRRRLADWSARPAAERAAALRRAADLYEENAAELTALATREAGKTLPDAIAEVREAVDFLRYYADQAEAATGARGVMVCISPWNFPLAIFTGQVAACLGAGNAVIAKPAEQTPLIAARAVGADARGRGAGGGAAAPAGGRAGGRGAADGGAGDRGRGLHRLDRGGAGDQPGAGGERGAGRGADRRDRRAERDDRRFDRADRAGGARRAGLGLPVGRAALLGAARPLRAGRGARAGAGDARGRDGGAEARRPLGSGDRRRAGDRRRGGGRDQGLYRASAARARC